MTTTRIYYSPVLDLIMTLEMAAWIIELVNPGDIWHYIGDL